MVLADSAIILFSLFASFSLRLDYFWLPLEGSEYPIPFEIIFGTPLIVIPIFYSLGLYKSVIRYIGFKGLWVITKGVTLYSLFWVLIGYMASVEGIPRSVILINWMSCILLIGGSRLFVQWIFSRYVQSSEKSNNVIIYGAGSAGIQLSHSLKLSNDFSQVAYIDDDETLVSNYINGIQIFPSKEIQYLVDKFDVKELFLAMPSVSRREKNKIISSLSFLSIRVRSLPSIYELAEGKVQIDDLRKISVNDLLSRVQVAPDEHLLKIKISDKVILVTGAGGSIGLELSHQILSLKPKKIILFDISEASLYKAEQELLESNILNIEIIPILGSVRNFQRLTKLCLTYKVETIYHAAAYKHVPLVESNVSEGVLNNTLGTLALAKAAIEANVKTFVLVSTDKAVRPTNIMGATKRAAELVLQAFSKEITTTCFTMVRFGNVLDSSGSVIPLFKKQIKQGGPVTVTDEAIVRYFMTIPEAVELVIQASAMGEGGDVFVLNMGKPVKIYDLAVKMIHLSGLQVLNKSNPKGDIEIIFTGLRPGEKLFEELLVGDDVKTTKNKLIMRSEESMIEWKILEPLLNKLQEAAIQEDEKYIRKILIQIVPEFKSQKLD
jgi:FlaA1/EpsC-like NDP-sugar epimerase